jgi:hypothetical protein
MTGHVELLIVTCPVSTFIRTYASYFELADHPPTLSPAALQTAAVRPASGHCAGARGLRLPDCLQTHRRELIRLPHRINAAAVAGRAVDEVSVGIRRQVLHFREPLIDIKVHQRHIASAALGALVVPGEVTLDVAVFAGHSQGAAISLVHDQKESRGWNLFEEIDLDILEHLSRRLLLVANDLLRYLLNESIVDFLD